MDISIIDEKNTDELWSELNLSSLLKGDDKHNNILSLEEQIELIELKNADRLQDPLLKKHIKKWKKPAYSILKDRYNAKPIIPPKIYKSKIEKLADPLRGKYSAYDKLLMNDKNDYSNSNINKNNDNNHSNRDINIYDNVPESSPRSNASSISILLGNDNDIDDRKISPEKAKANKASKTAFFLTETENDDNSIDSGDRYKRRFKSTNATNDKRGRIEWQDPKRIDYNAPKKLSRGNIVNTKRSAMNSNSNSNSSKKIASSGYGYKPKTTAKTNPTNYRRAKTNTSINDSVLNITNNSNSRFKTNTNINRNANGIPRNGLSRVKSTVALLPGGRVKKVSAMSGNNLTSNTRSSRSAPTLRTTNALNGLERIPELARKETIMRSLSGKPKTNTNSSNAKFNNNNIPTTTGKIKITNNEILKWKQNGKQKNIDNDNTNEISIGDNNIDNIRSIATNTTTMQKIVQNKDTTEILATLEKIEKIDSLRHHKDSIKYITNSKTKDSDITQLMAKVSKIGSKLADAQSHAAKYKDLTDTYFND